MTKLQEKLFEITQQHASLIHNVQVYQDWDVAAMRALDLAHCAHELVFELEKLAAE